MKATLKGRITSVIVNDGDAIITLKTAGKVDSVKVSNKDVSLDGTFKIKTLYAGEMKIGAQITLTISDEEIDPTV